MRTDFRRVSVPLDGGQLHRDSEDDLDEVSACDARLALTRHSPNVNASG
ncbi:MAG: hypothetical protein IPP40_09935 [bacterium]|nr:hypothetical protein [bacterium]